MSRRPAWVPPRKSIPKGMRQIILDRAAGLCERCGESFDDVLNPVEINHKTPVALGGDNALDNLEAIGRHCCHTTITSEQVKAITKADRQGGRIGQYARRKKRGGQIKSKGFDKRFKRKFNGKVEGKDA